MSGIPADEELQRKIRQLKESELERKETAEELAQIFSLSLDLICIADIRTASFIRVNPAFTHVLGYDEQEIVGKPFSDFIHPEDIDATRAVVEERLQAGTPVVNFENRYRCKDGSYKWLSWVSRPVPEAGKTYAVARDITDRKKAEQELEDQNRLMSTLLDNLQVGVFMVEAPSGRPLLANRQAIRLLGRGILNTADESTLAEVYQAYKAGTEELYPENEMPIVQGLKGRSCSVDDMVVVQPDGTHVHLQVFGSPVRDSRGHVVASLVSFSDITDRRRAEAEHQKLQHELFQSQRLESIGRLAGGVAHDFNNMLSVILGNAEVILEGTDRYDSVLANAEEIRKAAQRSSGLTRQLLAFARKQAVMQKVIDLNLTIDGMLAMLRRLIGEDIDLTWLPHEDLWPVRMDPSQVDQVLANLCVNARDAIRGVGKVTIETDNVRLDDEYCRDHDDCASGDYVLLAVSDSGSGMDGGTLEHIFEPFFTTKATGKGTGLGLATVYGIVKQNAGLVDVDSQEGGGTTFRLYFPRHEADGAQP